MTFTDLGEYELSNWMEKNAYIAWLEHGEPWEVEDLAIEKHTPPLNLRGNEKHPFYPTLSEIRRVAKEKAMK